MDIRREIDNRTEYLYDIADREGDARGRSADWRREKMKEYESIASEILVLNSWIKRGGFKDKG